MSEKFKAIPKPVAPEQEPSQQPVSAPSVNAGGGGFTNPEGCSPSIDTELRLQGNLASPPEQFEALSPVEALRVHHDLRLHQIEQELQNQELRRAQAVLENSRVRYLDLFFTDDNACLELDSSTHGLTGSGS